MSALHNRVNREALKEQLYKESFDRVTLSFYRYVHISAPREFRDRLYKDWSELKVFGRVYVAREGLNAQVSVPDHNFERFEAYMNDESVLKDCKLNVAYEDDGKSFFKLTVKVRDKIVADGLNDRTFDVTNVGRHLSPEEFHQAVDDPDTVIVDMRNFYEAEVGRFKNALYTDADSFKETLPKVEKKLADKKDKKILLYCTGGIRCEKASAYLKEQGFEDVNQLQGGITHYARTVEQKGWPSKFRGKNFTFDERLGERVTSDKISRCHQCGKPCDRHVNCANKGCHLLFIQCKDCEEKFDHCCSPRCREVTQLPEAERKKLYRNEYGPGRNVYNRLKNPYLKNMHQQRVKSFKKA